MPSSHPQVKDDLIWNEDDADFTIVTADNVRFRLPATLLEHSSTLHAAARSAKTSLTLTDREIETAPIFRLFLAILAGGSAVEVTAAREFAGVDDTNDAVAYETLSALVKFLDKYDSRRFVTARVYTLLDNLLRDRVITPDTAFEVRVATVDVARAPRPTSCAMENMKSAAPVSSATNKEADPPPYSPPAADTHAPDVADDTAWSTIRDSCHIAVFTALTSMVFGMLLTLLDGYIEPFDSSHLIGTAGSEPGLRWDAIHFVSIAKHGYQYEQQLAFQPGWQAVLRAGGMVAAYLRGRDPELLSDTDIVDASQITNIVCRALANVFLYLLTRTQFNRRVALLSSWLYAFAPTPAVLASPYTEPIYALTTFSGMYFTAIKQYPVAALLFAASTSVRSTGVFSCLILGWQIVFSGVQRVGDLGPLKTPFRLLYAAPLAGVVCAPFIGFQWYTYQSFCEPTPTQPWCKFPLPVSYSWVQRKYWNIGPFRYWTVDQLPNFAMVAPVLTLSLKGSLGYLASRLPTVTTRPPTDFIIGVYLHHVLLSAIVLFTSHTQIALRLASTDPVIWWAVALALVSPHAAGSAGGTRTASAWVWWTCIWGAVSLVLWAGHYPPA